jgi:hypothetical protein
MMVIHGLTLEEQQNNMLKEKLIENELIKIAGKTGLTHLLLKAKQIRTKSTKGTYQLKINQMQLIDFIDDVDEEQHRQ